MASSIARFWKITGPYEDGRVCLVEIVGKDQFSRGMFASAQEARARYQVIKAERAERGFYETNAGRMPKGLHNPNPSMLTQEFARFSAELAK